MNKFFKNSKLLYIKCIKNYLILPTLLIISLPQAFCTELTDQQVSQKSGSANYQKNNDCSGEECNSEAEELLNIMSKDYNGEGPKANVDQLKSMPKAKIIVLNKITAKSEEATLKVGETRFFGNLSLQVHKCLQNMDPYAENSLMLISVYENKVEEDQILVFNGWVVSSNPSISTLEHPVYEVIGRKCVE